MCRVCVTLTMVRFGPALVGAISIGTGAVAVFSPNEMYRLWPPRQDAHLRLMQAWGIGSIGLGMALCGASANVATATVSSISILWDLCWVPEKRESTKLPTMGQLAAGLNCFCIAVLFIDS